MNIIFNQLDTIDTKHYENIVLKNGLYTDNIYKSLDIVKEYIINNKLILVGGMAIDLALRCKGSNLYEDDTLPDYDFLSPQFHIDAYKLANKLIAAGMPSVSVINALHPSTMKVRIMFNVVADITYIPMNLYEKIPMIQHKEFRVVHPSFQYIDQHRSLSMPYENAPFETIMNRWHKDMKRHDMLYEKYPFKCMQTKYKTELASGSMNVFKKQCIGGILALAFWYHKAHKLGFTHQNQSNIQQIYEIIGNSTINSETYSIDLPKDIVKIVIYTCDKWTDITKRACDSPATNWIRMNAILEKIPVRWTNNKWDIIDASGHFIGAYKPWNRNIWIANLQTVAVYILTNLFMLQDPIFINMYIVIRDIIVWAAEHFNATNKAEYMVFLPTEMVYGSVEHNEANDIPTPIADDPTAPPPRKQPKKAYLEISTDRVPESYYKMDPSVSPIYQFNGLPTFKT